MDFVVSLILSHTRHHSSFLFITASISSSQTLSSSNFLSSLLFLHTSSSCFLSLYLHRPFSSFLFLPSHISSSLFLSFPLYSSIFLSLHISSSLFISLSLSSSLIVPPSYTLCLLAALPCYNAFCSSLSLKKWHQLFYMQFKLSEKMTLNRINWKPWIFP